MPLARRHLMQAVILAVPYSLLTAASREFWKNKKAAEWGTDEKEQLLSQSPWAREGMLRFSKEEKHGGQAGPPAGGGPPVAVPGARPGGAPGSGSAVTSVPFGEPPPAPPPWFRQGRAAPIQSDGALGKRQSRSSRRRAQSTRGGGAILRNSSHRHALDEAAPRRQGRTGDQSQSGHARGHQADQPARAKEQKTIPCSHLLTGEGERATELLLFFPKGPDPIVPADREVTVVSRFGPFQLSIRFPLKEMMFDGALEL